MAARVGIDVWYGIVSFSNNVYIVGATLAVALVPDTHYGKRGGAIMKDNKATMRKTIGWASLAYGAFTAISIIGPLILERLWSRKR
jgi:hypothetical protein